MKKRGIRKEDALRIELDEIFKPMFAEHDVNNGMPKTILYENLRASGLPKRRIMEFVKNADTNLDERVTYHEFQRQMLRVDETTYQLLTGGQKLLAQAVFAIAPNIRRQPKRVPIDANELWGEDLEMLSYTQAYTCRPPPFFIPLITAAEIAVFIYYAVELGRDNDVNNDVTAISGWPSYSPLVWNPYRRIDVWRFFTYAFIHNGYTHLIFNCLLQLVLGTLLELVHKFWRVGLVYLLGVIAGSLAHSIFDPVVYLVGASGGCYALIGAHFATVIINWEEMQHDWLRSPIHFFASGVFRLALLTLLAGGDTGLAIYSRLTDVSAAKIGFAAHAGGFIAGILVGIPILKNLEVKKWEKTCFWICLVIYAVLMIAAILFNVFCANFQACYRSRPILLP